MPKNPGGPVYEEWKKEKQKAHEQTVFKMKLEAVRRGEEGGRKEKK